MVQECLPAQEEAPKKLKGFEWENFPDKYEKEW